MIKLGEKQKLTVVKKVEFGVYLAQSPETSEDRVLCRRNRYLKERLWETP